MKYKIEEIKNRILQGDTLTELKKFPDEVIDTIITSPPYWGLRSYLPDEHPDKVKELGLEPTLDLFIDHLLQITAELKRVLKKTGVLWWNHGDSYCSQPAGNTMENYKEWEGKGDGMIGRLAKRNTNAYKDLNKIRFDKKKYGGKQGVHSGRSRGLTPYKAKCMWMQNERLIMKMIDSQGWVLRNKIIWHKSNSMPSSVKDRLSNTYEPVFMLVKNNKPVYYYNIKTGLMADRKPKELKEGIDWDWQYKDGSWQRPSRDEIFNLRDKSTYAKSGYKKVSYWHSVDYWFDLDSIRVPHSQTTIERMKYGWNEMKHEKAGLDIYHGVTAAKMMKRREKFNEYDDFVSACGKNPGDIFTIATSPFSDAHFATFPEKLVEPFIKASCPMWICKKCGRARVRISKAERTKETPNISKEALEYKQKNKQMANPLTRFESTHYTTGWSKCSCGEKYEAGIVLDPFMGAGTTAIVAKKLGRNYIGIELNKEYIKMSLKRLKKVHFQTNLFK